MRLKRRHGMKQNKFSQNTDNEGVMPESVEQEGKETTDNVAVEADNVSENNTTEAEEWRERYIRLSAEFDNYRKRTMREKLDLITSGGEQVILTLLPIVDDFGRALDAIEKSDDIEQLRQGITLISNKLNEALRSQGVI
jgi:molecular chaperone GrpE